MATDPATPRPEAVPLIEGVDYTIEAGRWVFTAAYHLKRGHCCGSGCRHCPFEDWTQMIAGRQQANSREG